MDRTRREVLFSGRVQGVGFRVTTRTIARDFAVTGFVKNLSDGRVELVVEGEPAEVKAFLVRLEESVSHLVQDRQTAELAASGEFPDFQIRY